MLTFLSLLSLPAAAGRDPWDNPVKPGDPPWDCVNDPLPTQTLEEFAADCDAATGITVPDFDCDDGTLVPTTDFGGPYNGDGTCDRPNMLHSTCDPDSRFQILEDSGTAIAVAHCRKQGHDPGRYGDIAVIQYNRTNGATCFYQALGDLSGQVRAPSAGAQAYDWYSPAETAGTNCVGCHDNGPFIRSPYLAQLSGSPNPLPGTVTAASEWGNANSWNKAQPYRFVGNDFQDWKVYSISSSDTTCTTCHRLAISSVNGTFQGSIGTAQDFAERSTSATHVHKNPPSATSPLWMPPNAIQFSQQYFDAALAIDACATEIASGGSPSECQAVKYGDGITCLDDDTTVTVNGGTQSDPTDGRVDVTIDLTMCAPGEEGCEPGFCYWTAIHGPFWQDSPSSVELGAADYRGSFDRIFVEDGYWKVRYFSDAGGASMPAPGGKVACTHFSSVSDVEDTDSCFGFYSAVSDPTGGVPSGSTTLSALGELDTFTGLIGNVCVDNGLGYAADEAGVFPAGADTALAFSHHPRKAFPSAMEIEGWMLGCPDWQPDWIVQDVYSDSDVRLVDPDEAADAVCFITAVTGTWDITHDQGKVQPFAEIYWGSYGDLRMRVVPTDTAQYAPEAVGAYASCIRKR
ncbi:MAG: hypothetical protein R3F59_25310 [Myxococcota bacterium]